MHSTPVTIIPISPITPVTIRAEYSTHIQNVVVHIIH